jgi:hypothetical protein
MALTCEKVSYRGWSNCVRLTNGKIEIIATTDVGPRIIRMGFVGGQNFMKEYEPMMGKTGSSEWCIYGGHRLWHAPEVSPRTYCPDNNPITHNWDGTTLKLIQPVEPTTGIVKEIELTMCPASASIKILHRLTNKNMWSVELAPWALTVLAQGGRAIIPQEEYRSHSDYLLPARPLVLWHYTNMADKRWTWSEKYIQLRQDPNATTPQKVGLFNTRGWAAYALNNQLFVKQYRSVCAPHTDMGSNTELFTNGDMLELETVGPLTNIEPGKNAEHVENWFIYDQPVGTDDVEISQKILPLIKSL